MSVARAGAMLLRRLVYVVMLALAVGGGLAGGGVLPGSSVTWAQDDVCPEPNDEVQAACYLDHDTNARAALVGFITNSDDIDTYRFELTDFNQEVFVEIFDAPVAYRLGLWDWDGKLIMASENGSLFAQPPMPGSYYLVVDSGTGQFSPSAPYRIGLQRFVPARQTYRQPNVLLNEEYRAGQDILRRSSDAADVVVSSGRLTVRTKEGGTPDQPRVEALDLAGQLADFLFVIDTRLVAGTHPRFTLYFRARGDDRSGYHLVVDPRGGTVSLLAVSGATVRPLKEVATPALNTTGRVNRLVIRAVGPEVKVNVNGQDIVLFPDTSFADGQLGLLVEGWQDATEMRFDNLLLVSATNG